MGERLRKNPIQASVDNRGRAAGLTDDQIFFPFFLIDEILTVNLTTEYIKLDLSLN